MTSAVRWVDRTADQWVVLKVAMLAGQRVALSAVQLAVQKAEWKVDGTAGRSVASRVVSKAGHWAGKLAERWAVRMADC